MILTVTRLARQCGLSRSTVLYYESIGLLKAARRSRGNYRTYAANDLRRLKQICIYRDAGLKLSDIRALLDGPQSDASAVLKCRLSEIAAEIEKLREHQWAIVKLLQNKQSLRRANMVTKDKWVAIMKATGFTEEDMHRWHAEFERSAPDEHQEFLEFLHIPAAEIRSIRDWSREQRQ